MARAEFRYIEPALRALTTRAGDDLAEDAAEDIAHRAARIAPRDSGRLAASHFVRRRPMGWQVANRAPYARFVHEGRGPGRRTAQPWTVEALILEMRDGF